MPFKPPKHILVTRDANELTLIKIIKTKEGMTYQYRFTVSETKKDTLVEFSEVNLVKLLNYSFKEI